MNQLLEPRSNQQWLVALRSEGELRAMALQDLRACILEKLPILLRGRGEFEASILDELASLAVAAVVYSLDRYREQSSFKNWALAISTRAVFSEVKVRDFANKAAGLLRQIDKKIARRNLRFSLRKKKDRISSLRELANSVLNASQQRVILSLLEGIPLAVTASELGSSTKELFELFHSGRVKLRAALIARGYAFEDLAMGTIEVNSDGKEAM